MIELTPSQITEIEADIADSPEYWEAVKAEAEAVLASLKPSSKSKRAICARQTLAEYEEWRRTFLVPKKWKGKWSLTAEGYRIRTAKSARPGDTCIVTLSSGEERIYSLDESHGSGMFSGHRVDSGFVPTLAESQVTSA